LEVLVTRPGATLLRGLADLVITVQEVVLKYYKGRFANTRNRNDKGGFSSIGKKTRKKLALFSAGVSIFLNFSGCSDFFFFETSGQQPFIDSTIVQYK
jgi:hypothetical protein